MGNAHEVVVDYICKIIGRKAVRLDQNHVVKFLIVDRYITVNLIGECGPAFPRNIQANDMRNSRCQIGLYLLL